MFNTRILFRLFLLQSCWFPSMTLADPEKNGEAPKIHLTKRQNSTGNDLAYSPPFYPSPWMDPEADGWQDAYAQAYAVVSEMTLLEKVNLTTGVGYVSRIISSHTC